MFGVRHNPQAEFLYERKRSGLSSSWGTPLCARHVPRLRQDRRRQANCSVSTRPPLAATMGTPGNKQGFRSSIAWLYTLAVYASQPPSPTTTQDSLPAVGQTLPSRILTHRVPLKGFCDVSYITILLSQVKLDTMPLLACQAVRIAKGLSTPMSSAPRSRS